MRSEHRLVAAPSLTKRACIRKRERSPAGRVVLPQKRSDWEYRMRTLAQTLPLTTTEQTP